MSIPANAWLGDRNASLPNADQKIRRRKRFHDRVKEGADQSSSSRESSPNYDTESDDGEEGWRNSEGERLRDFGVEEDVEFYDEEDIPLAILMQQRARRQ